VTGQSLVLAAITALAAYFSFLLLQPFLFALVTATAFAIVFMPVNRRIASILRSRGVSALLTTFFVIVCVLVPLGFAVVAASEELRDLYRTLRKGSGDSTIDWVAGWIEHPLEWISRRTGLDVEEVRTRLMGELPHGGRALLGVGRSVLAGIGETVIQVVTALVALFFFLRDGDRIHQALLRHIPIERNRVETLLTQVSDSILANMYGVVAVGAAQGTLTGIGMWAAGAHAPFLWGVIAAILSLVPLFGTGLVWGPAAFALAVHGSWGKALFLAIWGAVVVANSDNFVRPWAVSGRTGMNPLLVLFGLLGGMRAFGVLGIFLGPVILSITATLLNFTANSLSRRPDA
jgi:predicted PurR-regulated permease PerM